MSSSRGGDAHSPRPQLVLGRRVLMSLAAVLALVALVVDVAAPVVVRVDSEALGVLIAIAAALNES